MNNMTITNQYNTNMIPSMIPSIIFGEYGFCFIFVDTANNTCLKSEAATVEWLAKNNIEIDEFLRHCWSEYDCMKDAGVTHGIISYFTTDDDIIYTFSQNIDVADSYKKILNY